MTSSCVVRWCEIAARRDWQLLTAANKKLSQALLKLLEKFAAIFITGWENKYHGGVVGSGVLFS